MSMRHRMFDLGLRVKISPEEGIIVLDYLKASEGLTGEIGHVLSKKAQEMLDDLVAKATMYHDKKGQS